jgi:hypothetical protein
MKKFALALLLVLGLAGCATPAQYSTAPMAPYDRDTDYQVDERNDGFAVTIYYSRYQFFPESSAVATAYKSAATAIAHDVADRRGRQIEPLDEQRIRISMGRNGLTGITSCSVQAIAKWRTDR